MNTQCAIAVLIAVTCLARAQSPSAAELDREVREFVRKSVDAGSVMDHFNREKSHRILTNPNDWEAVLSEMLDINRSSETEIEIVLSTITYRKTSGDPRIRSALLHLMEQRYAEAALSAANSRKGIEEPPSKNPYLNSKKRLALHATTLARMEDSDILYSLMEYAISTREEELLAFTDPTYANIFIATKAVGAEKHAELIKELLPKLRQRGMKEKTIELGKEAVRAIEGVKRPDRTGLGAQDGNRTDQVYSGSEKPESGAVRGAEDRRPSIATLAAGVLASMILLLLGRTWWKKSHS